MSGGSCDFLMVVAVVFDWWQQSFKKENRRPLRNIKRTAVSLLEGGNQHSRYPFSGPVQAAEEMRSDLKTARRPAMNACRREPRSHGNLTVKASASAVVDWIQRDVFVMGFPNCFVIILCTNKLTAQKGMSLAAETNF